MAPPAESRGRRFARYLLALVFVGAGLLHFVRPEPYLAIMPPYLPAHAALVFWSGVFEVLGGVGLLLPPPVRRWAGIGLALLLVAVFPANLHMAVEGIGLGGVLGLRGTVGRALLWLRLPLQAALIAWALWASGVWPRPRA